VGACPRQRAEKNWANGAAARPIIATGKGRPRQRAREREGNGGAGLQGRGEHP
jgi:hypothetical protein